MPEPSGSSRAPEGAQCEQHPERAAPFTCPRCGSYACVACWHPAVERCTRCLLRDPTDAAPPIAWEAQGLLAGSRFRLRRSRGTYFQLADYSAISELGDVDFARWLTIASYRF